MSQHQVWTCDLCGKEIAKADVRTFYGGPAVRPSACSAAECIEVKADRNVGLWRRR